MARLSLGLTWDKLSELRAQFRTRVEKDGRGDAFHHFVDYLLEAGEVDDEVAQRDCVLKTCEEQSCEECKTFISVFNGQRYSDHVALANRRYLYDRVEKSDVPSVCGDGQEEADTMNSDTFFFYCNNN